MRIAVIGMGYVGIPAAALFADVDGFSVVGVQRRSVRSGWKIDLLNEGKSPFPQNEPGIADLIKRVVIAKKTLSVTDSYSAVEECDATLIDVQTPVEEGGHTPRYDSLREVAMQVGMRMKPGALVCVESTVAPGTMVNVVKPLLEDRSSMIAGQDFFLCFSYERVMVGRLLHNIQTYPRVVGGLTAKCGRKGAQLYKHIVRAPVVSTDCLTAEVAKTVENAYRDVNIAFANEVALVCESLGIDVYEVRELVNNLPNDPSSASTNPVRNMHIPGAGVGGHCLPKDSWLMKYGVDTYGTFPVDLEVIVHSRRVNDYMPAHMAALVVDGLGRIGVPLFESTVAILGYAFLEDSDDTRNTPAASLIVELKKRGVGRIVVTDPFVRDEATFRIQRDVYRALEGADCACVVTRHSVYQHLNREKVRSVMNHPFIVDGRHMLSHWDGTSGFHVVTVGIGKRRTAMPS
jgi:UDP-N-acetyl-D-mannosaminuronic acid dehydrogenase